jgi:Kef-type K+ transport system membrane component KefB
MKKVLIYSLLLVAGLVMSQVGASLLEPVRSVIVIATMLALSYIMIHVGYEFDIDKSKPRQYLVDYGVAFTAATFPWIFCALYFVFVMAPSGLWGHLDLWKESLLAARFSAPTSAGVLFSMLAAAGLAATWIFRKARILAIFDDLDTILLMIPLKIMMVGFKWQLMAVVVLIVLMLWMAWRYLNTVKLPTGWVATLSYAAIITAVSEVLYRMSKWYDPNVPVHVEVLLPAFVLGCMIRSTHGEPHPHQDDMAHGKADARASVAISAIFMVLVGMNMPPINTGAQQQATPAQIVQDASPTPAAPTAEEVARETTEAPLATEGPAIATPGTGGQTTLTYEGADPQLLAEKRAFPGWDVIALHVLVITVLSNIGKMFPAFCYRREAHWKERLAVAVGMWPRGEVGAGVLVVSLSYGIGGPILTVAVLSLALNLLCTGLFIVAVKRLLATVPQDYKPEIVRA